MIEAMVHYDTTQGRVKLRLVGHADTAPCGQDLVCAAASGLALTAAEAARMLEKQGMLLRPPKIRLKKGDAVVLVTPKPEAASEVLMAFWTVQTGLYALAKRYPEGIRLDRVLRV